jgi:hypothetical protein
VHLVVLNDAPPGLTYRIFKDGTPLLIRDAAAYKSRLARAILEYLDFRPVEELFTQRTRASGKSPSMPDQPVWAIPLLARGTHG